VETQGLYSSFSDFLLLGAARPTHHPQAALQIIVEEEEKAELWMIKGLKDTEATPLEGCKMPN
jgi:hypothetical protein